MVDPGTTQVREFVLDIDGTSELNPTAQTSHINFLRITSVSQDLKASFRAGKLKTRPTLADLMESC